MTATTAPRLTTLAALLLAAACGTGRTAPSTPSVPAGSSVTVVLDPVTAEVDPDGEIAFTATVTGTADTGVTWAVVEGSVAGAIAQGKFKATSAEGLYHVVATSTADPTRTATATVTTTRRRFSVSPSSAALAGCQAAAFTAKLGGAGAAAASWSIREGAAGGTVTSTGLYTAPQAAGIYHLVAVASADPTKVVTVPLTVTTKVISVSLGQTSLALGAGAVGQLGASVVTTCGTFASP